MTHDAVGARSQSPLLALLLRHFQPFFPPQPIHSLAVDLESFGSQQRPDAPIAVTRMSAHHLQHLLCQRLFFFAFLRHVTLARPWLIDHSTGPTLGNFQLPPHALHARTPTRRAYPFPRNSLASLRICLSSV